MMNVNNNVIKNCKIKEGLKYYELNVKNDYYFISLFRNKYFHSR